MRNTAFAINGGAGRIICSIPALEEYERQNPDDDFIIISEFSTEVFSGHPTLYKRVYPYQHKNLFLDKIKDRNIIIPEPYAVWEYYNQKCNIAQAFDININNKGVRPVGKPTIKISRADFIKSLDMINEFKKATKKDKVIVFQPFGRGTDANMTGKNIDIDFTGKSFSVENAASLIRKIENKCAVMLMNPMPVDFSKYGCKNEVAYIPNSNLRQWMSVISHVDMVVGCDSVAQHVSNIFDKKTVVVLGSTFKENVSYPENNKFKIFDIDENKKMYVPIRLCNDDISEVNNERLMNLQESDISNIADYILKNL